MRAPHKNIILHYFGVFIFYLGKKCRLYFLHFKIVQIVFVW